MSSTVIDPYTNLNSLGGLSNGVIDILTNVNSVAIPQPGSGILKLHNAFNVNVDDTTIGINNNSQIYVKSVGNVDIENSYINFNSTDGINISSGQVELGGTLVVNVDNTVIRTNKIYQEILGNIKLGDGTNSTNFSTGALVIEGGIGINGNINTSGNIKLGDGTNSTNFSTGALIVSGGVGVNGNINSFGNVTATRLCSSSDIRLKKEIIPLENCLSKINEINTVSYKWRKRKGKKRDNILNYGVIAQQLEEIGLEHMVITTEENFKSVSYTQLIPMLIGSIKELTKRIEYIENKNK